MYQSLPRGDVIELADPSKAYLCPDCYTSLERFSKLKESFSSVQTTLTAKVQAVISAGIIVCHHVESDSCSDNRETRKRPEHDHHESSGISGKRSRMMPRQLDFSTVDVQSPAVVISYW